MRHFLHENLGLGEPALKRQGWVGDFGQVKFRSWKEAWARFCQARLALPRRPSRLWTIKVLSASHTMCKGQHWIPPHGRVGWHALRHGLGSWMQGTSKTYIQDSGLIGDTNRVRGITTWNGR